MAERVRVAEAARRTGVPGTDIYLAIWRGELQSEHDPRGYDWVDLEDVERIVNAAR